MISIKTDEVISDEKVLSDDELNQTAGGSFGFPDLSKLMHDIQVVQANRIGGLLSWLESHF